MFCTIPGNIGDWYQFVVLGQNNCGTRWQICSSEHTLVPIKLAKEEVRKTIIKPKRFIIAHCFTRFGKKEIQCWPRNNHHSRYPTCDARKEEQPRHHERPV